VHASEDSPQTVCRCNLPSVQRTMRLLFPLVLFFLIAQLSFSQEAQSVKIQVQFDQLDGTISPIWNYFGYDEPNYTYAPNGKNLLGELAPLDAAPVYVRVHNLLTTGDGSASLKWGSTNVYSEDASGHPVYSWVILDQIFDTFRAAGVRSYGFRSPGLFQM
jgi:xylan 1,4-beta-xylosidase